MTNYWILPLWLTIHSPLLCELLLAHCQYLHRFDIVRVGHPTLLKIRWCSSHFNYPKISIEVETERSVSGNRSSQSAPTIQVGPFQQLPARFIHKLQAKTKKEKKKRGKRRDTVKYCIITWRTKRGVRQSFSLFPSFFFFPFLSQRCN